ncbi:50S ribosomal protein L22 [Patescibacteria group bacterium]|nr:50S ribosomal protein L22 [Patescibacteria group bacterium]
MEFTATAKNIRVAPRKARLVASVVKGMPATMAMNKLQFLAKSASTPIAKVIKSAVANAKGKENLMVKNILVDEGIKMKRRDTSHGARFGGGVINKKASHIKVVLTD